MTLAALVGFWDVTELVTLYDCEQMSLDGFDVRFENGRALIPVYQEDAW